MNATVKYLFGVVCLIVLNSNAMEEDTVVKVGLSEQDIQSITDLPKYYAQVLRAAAELPLNKKTDSRMVSTFSPYDGEICTLLSKWAEHTCALGYPSSNGFPDEENFLILKGSIDSGELNNIETAYQAKIAEMQRGWKQRLVRNDHFWLKNIGFEGEVRLIRCLATRFEIELKQLLQTSFRRIHLEVEEEELDRFLEVFCLKIEKKRKREEKGDED